MEKERFNNGYESSARIIFYMVVTIPVIIIIVAAREFSIIIGALFLLFGLDPLLKSLNEEAVLEEVEEIEEVEKVDPVYEVDEVSEIIDSEEEPIRVNAPQPNKLLRFFFSYFSKRKQEEFLGDLLEIKEKLRERNLSKHQINLLLTKHLISIVLIQIKLVFLKLLKKGKSKEVDQ